MKSKLMKYLQVILLCIFNNSFVNAQNDITVLPWTQSYALNSYLMREVHEQYENRKEEIEEAFTSMEEMLKYKEDRRKRYFNILGELPIKQELNATTINTTIKNDFRIENIIYESIPNRHVTANLYIPDGNGPFPIIIHLCGHAQSGKGYSQIIKESLLLVKNGFAVFVVDPISQGERVQLTDEEGNSLTRGATTEHTLLNAGANLVGTGIPAQEYWDNTRAIDYLETRPEIDINKLGCIGSSGGGTQTTFLAAADPRIKAAVICSFITTTERKLEIQGGTDGCHHIPYEGRKQLEMGDYLIMFAPKPLLIMAGKYDFVDYWGTEQTFNELKKVYSILDEPENVELFTIDFGHGMPKSKREASVKWFKKWHENIDNFVQEDEIENLTIEDKELLCTNTRQVVTNFKNEQSIQEYNYVLSKKYSSNRRNFVKSSTESLFKERVLELLGIRFPKEKISIELTGKFSYRTHDVYKYQIIRKGQIPVPCLVYISSFVNPKGKVIVYFNENGKSNIASNKDIINPYMNNGDILILADLRGFGETVDALEKNDAKFWNKEFRNAVISLHIGKPMMGQRVIDVMSIIDFIETRSEMQNREIEIIANGIYGPTVIHSVFLDNRINGAVISRSIKSFEEYLRNPLQRDMFSNVLYGVLKYYDLPDLVEKIGKTKIIYQD